VDVHAFPNRKMCAPNSSLRSVIGILHPLSRRKSCSFCHRVYLCFSYDTQKKHPLFSYTALNIGLYDAG
jgi:hypothetical protein